MRGWRRGCRFALALAWLAAMPPLAAQEPTDQETTDQETTGQETTGQESTGPETTVGDAPVTGEPQQVAVLQGLDKITARISTFDAPLDNLVTFGSLKIRVHACHKRPPEEPPESAAFLEVIDDRPDSEPIPVFSGWMFASSPALSALEHAVYDVWVLDCKSVEAGPAEGEPAANEAAADND